MSTEPSTALKTAAACLAGCGALCGSAGVIAAAGAAHGAGNENLKTAADFLLLHAGAIVAIAAFALAVRTRAAWCLAAGALLLLGTLLFSGDLAARALLQTRLFPMAAPTGGTLLILGWLAGAGTAFAAALQKRS